MNRAQFIILACFLGTLCFLIFCANIQLEGIATQLAEPPATNINHYDATSYCKLILPGEIDFAEVLDKEEGGPNG